MRERGIALNERQAKFVSLVASGGISVTEAYVRAGYGTKRDSGNANKLRRSLDSWIVAEREKLGLAPLGEEIADIDDSEIEAVLAQARATYAMAVGAGDVKSAVKATKTIADILRKRGKPGRPATATPQAQTSGATLARMPPEDFTAFVDSILELPEIEDDSALA